MTKPWWIWRWKNGGGNSVSTQACPTKQAALKAARELGGINLKVNETTLRQVTQEEFEAFDHELYMMWC